MSELLHAMLLVLIAWVGLYSIFTGLGLFVRRSFGLGTQRAESLLASFWIGWAFAILILQLWHLQFRVDWRVFVLVSTIGAAGLLWNWRDIWLVVRKGLSGAWILCFVLLLTAAWLANRAIAPPASYDSGLYHFPSIRWALSYPIVPGLGNLHGRFAFNSSYFLYVAMLEVGPWAHRSHHLANGLLLLALTTQVLLSSLKLLKNSGGSRIYHLFHVLLLTPVIRLALGHDFSSPDPDFPIFVLGIVLSVQLLALLDKPQHSHKETRYAAFSITTLAALGITVKLSFSVFGVATLLLALAMWYVRSGKHNKTEGARALVWLSMCGAMILLLWVIRGIILSGYVAYPITVGSFPVEWRVPRASAIREANWIRSWARQPRTHWSQVLGNWDWLEPWARRTFRKRFDVQLPLVLVLAACFLGLLHRLTKKGPWKKRGAQWLFLLPPIVSLVFWFAVAPALKFAGACFWILGAGSVALAIGEFSEATKSKVLRIVLCLSVIVAVGPVLIAGEREFMKVAAREKNPIRALLQLGIDSDFTVGPGESNGFHATPQADLKTFVTHSGLTIYVPREGDQCWDAPLPCAPGLRANLRLREEGELRSGFISASSNMTGIRE